MNNRVNYTFVGILVLIGFGLMLGFTYWMIKPSAEDKTKIYNIFFDESVLGLNIDAPVKYRGISVGKVISLKISEADTEQVQVQVKILKSTPIKESTVARLTAQGITGLTYINLSLGEMSAPKLRKKEGETCPTIKTIPSFFDNIEQSLGSVSMQLSKTLEGTQKLLNEKNQKEIAIILKNSASLSAKLNKILDDKTIVNIQKTAENMESLTHKIDILLPKVNHLIDKSIVWEGDISKSMSSIMESYIGITATMNEIKRAVANGEFNIKEISADIVPTMNDTFMQMQELMIRVEDTLKEYKRSPSDVLFKKEAIQKAPGEK